MIGFFMKNKWLALWAKVSHFNIFYWSFSEVLFRCLACVWSDEKNSYPFTACLAGTLAWKETCFVTSCSTSPSSKSAQNKWVAQQNWFDKLGSTKGDVEEVTGVSHEVSWFFESLRKFQKTLSCHFATSWPRRHGPHVFQGQRHQKLIKHREFPVSHKLRSSSAQSTMTSVG